MLSHKFVVDLKAIGFCAGRIHQHAPLFHGTTAAAVIMHKHASGVCLVSVANSVVDVRAGEEDWQTIIHLTKMFLPRS